MKKIVIFYSLDGNTKFIAQKITEKLGADILQLKPEKEIPKIEPLKHLLGGKQVLSKETPKLKKYDINFADYDTLIIGTPVWAYNFSPVIRTFLKENNFKNKKIILFCTYIAGQGKALAGLEKELEGNEIIGQAGFRSVLRNQKENTKKLQDFLQNIKGKI